MWSKQGYAWQCIVFVIYFNNLIKKSPYWQRNFEETVPITARESMNASLRAQYYTGIFLTIISQSYCLYM